jgi:hypothetical protein
MQFVAAFIPMLGLLLVIRFLLPISFQCSVYGVIRLCARKIYGDPVNVLRKSLILGLYFP